jgi:hypothetical protein
VLAFFFKFVKGTPVFLGAICGQALVLYIYKNTDIVYLWFNVFGCFAVIGSAFVIHSLMGILNKNRSGGSND